MSEAQILSQLDHPNVIKYHEVFKDSPESLTILMEYADDGDIQGKLLQARKAFRHVPEETILGWLAQVVHALQYLHAHGIIHRDVKTANMFLTKNGTVKLGDFGVSRQFEVCDAQACVIP